MPTDKLKPCPFCGSSNLEYHYEDIEGWVAHVRCIECDDMIGPMSKYKYDNQHEAAEDAASIWNRRSLTAAEQADKTQTKHAQQDRVYRNTEPRDGFVEDGLVPIDKWGPPTEGGSTLPVPRLRPHNASSFHEPFGYWVKHKYSDGVLLRKPSYIPKADENTSVIPLFTEPAPAARSGAVKVRPLVNHWPEAHEVADIVAGGKGFWRSCSGCHELNEGHPTGPWSVTLGCSLGNGCYECGGIGAVWDTTDYADMGDVLSALEPAEPTVADKTDVEPVAYGVKASNTMRFSSVYLACDYEHEDLGSYRKDLIVPLYAHPPESRLREALEACAEWILNNIREGDIKGATVLSKARAALAQEDGR